MYKIDKMKILEYIYANTCDKFDQRPILSLFAVTVFLSFFFYSFPSVDRAATALFYQPGAGFPATRIEALRDFRNLAANLTVILPVAFSLGLFLKLVYPSKPCLFSPRMSLYFISLFLIGPALMVNGVLKSFWGRPRPVNITEFGGIWPFQEAWVIGEHGLLNRSFTSGEAATIACLLPLALFVPREWRWQVATLIGVLVVATSLNRIAFGAHFLSDVTISIGLMLTLAAALHRLFFVDRAEMLCDAALEARLTAYGQRWAADRAAFRRRSGEVLAAFTRAVGTFLTAQGAAARMVAGRSEASIGGEAMVRALVTPLAAPLSSLTGGRTVRRLSQTTPNRS